MILLRTTAIPENTRGFAERLVKESGHRVCIVVDEFRGPVDVGPFEKISLNRESCRAAALHCPPDVGWRCGDYGFYLARQRFPDEPYFWLVEYDVRFGGPDLGAFFGRFDSTVSADLIAGHYRLAERSWFWTHTMAARDDRVWCCLFPVVRLSSAAIDLLHAQRKSYARRLTRLANWPNDESFVATILTRAGMACADLNDFGSELYDDTTYTYARPVDGDAFDERATPLKIFHPVLYGEDLQRKITRMALVDKGESLAKKVKRHLVAACNSVLPA